MKLLDQVVYRDEFGFVTHYDEEHAWVRFFNDKKDFTYDGLRTKGNSERVKLSEINSYTFADPDIIMDVFLRCHP